MVPEPLEEYYMEAVSMLHLRVTNPGGELRTERTEVDDARSLDSIVIYCLDLDILDVLRLNL